MQNKSIQSVIKAITRLIVVVLCLAFAVQNAWAKKSAQTVPTAPPPPLVTPTNTPPRHPGSSPQATARAPQPSQGTNNPNHTTQVTTTITLFNTWTKPSKNTFTLTTTKTITTEKAIQQLSPSATQSPKKLVISPTTTSSTGFGIETCLLVIGAVFIGLVILLIIKYLKKEPNLPTKK